MSDRSSDPSDVIFEIRVQPLNGEAAFTVRADPYDTILDLKTRISEYKSANNSATSSETKDGDDIPVERLLLYKDGVTLEDFGLFSMYEIYNKDTLNLWDCAWRDEDYREPPATTPIKLDCNSVDVSDQYAVATFINSLFKNKRRGSVVGTLVQRDGSFRVPGYEDVKDQFLPLLSQFEKMEDKKLALRTLDEFMWTFRTAWKTGGSTDEVKREMGDLWARLFVESELNDQEAKDELKTTEKCLHGIAFDRDVVHAFIKRARQGETLESSHPVVQWLMDRFSGYPDTKIFNALLELGGPLRENQIKQDLLSVCRQFENEEDGHLAYPQLLGIYLQEGQEEDALRFMEKERKEDYYYDLKNYVNEVPYVCLTQASSVKRNFEACIQKLVEDLDELQGIKVEELRNSYTEDKKDEYAHVLSRGIEGDNDNVDTAEITTGGANMDSEISDIPISNVTAWLALLHRSCQVLSFRFGGENPDSSQDWKSVAHQIEEDIRSVVAQNPNAKFLAQIADAVVPQLRFRWRSFFELLEALSKQQEDEEVFMIITKVAFKKRLSSAGLDRRSSIVGLAKRRSSIFGMERVPESTPLSI